MKKSKQEIIDILLSGKETRHILLFDTSKSLRSFCEMIGNELKNHPKFTLDMNIKYRLANNMIQVNKAKIFLGLAKDESLLSPQYKQQEINYYDKGED